MDRKLHATEDDEDGLTGVEELTPHEFDPNSEDDLKYQDEMALDKTTESKMLRILAKGVVPLSTSVGFALVPSSNMALRLAGAAAGGLAGLVSRSSLLKRVERMKDLCESERPQTDITPMNVYDEVLHGVDRRNVVLRRLAEGIIPAAIFTGFAAIPSNNIALRLLGAAVGWVGGIVTEDRAQQLLIKSDKDRFNSEVAVSEVPQTVQDALDALHEVRTPWTELTCADLCAIARQHRVNPRHIDVFLSLAAGEVIFAAVQVDGLDLFQNLAGVLNFAGNGGMPYAAIAHGLAFAGFKVSDQLEPSTDGTAIHNDDFDPEVLAQAAKVLFLSEHLLAKKKGYLEGKIVPALASFPPEMYKLYLTADTTALFEEVCRLAFIEHEEFDDDTVPAYMEFLTVSREVSGFQPSDMYDTIRQAVLTELAENLPESSPPLEANFTDFHRLEQGCKALGIVGQDFNYTVIRHTQSFFDDAAQVLVQAVVDRPESAPHMQAKLLERLATLKIDLHSAGQTLRRLTQAQNEIFQERIGNLYRVADPGTKEATASRALVAYAHIFEALQYLAAPFTGDKPLTPPQLPFDAATRAHILQAKAKMTGDTMAVSEVETQILELKDGAGHFVHQSLAIAKTRKFILDSIRADKFNPDAKQMYMSKLSECGVSGSAWQATALNIFHDEMTRVAARPVPTQQEMDRLDRVRDFLDISADDARTVYLDKLGEKYCKAVEESLTAEGGISMEYAFGLQRLRTRLNITLDDAKLLFYLETKKHFGPVVKGIIDAWKAETDGSYQRQNAQQPPKVFMREVMNMLDLRDQVCRLMDCEGGLEEELHVTGTGLATSEESVELFKHFLLHRISEQDPELRQRYVDRSPQLANFLEITPEDQDDIRRSLSFSTYRRLLTNALRAHDEVPQTLIQQFAYLKQGLQLTDEEAEIIYAEATKKAIADNAEELLDASEKGQRFSAASAKRIRQQVMAATFKQRIVNFSCLILLIVFCLSGCIAGDESQR